MFRRSSLFILAPLSAVVALLLTLSPAGATPNHHTMRNTKGACHVTTHITRLSDVQTKYSATRTERVTVTTRGTACARAQLSQLGTHRTKNSTVRAQRASAPAPGIRTRVSCDIRKSSTDQVLVNSTARPALTTVTERLSASKLQSCNRKARPTPGPGSQSRRLPRPKDA